MRAGHDRNDGALAGCQSDQVESTIPLEKHGNNVMEIWNVLHMTDHGLSSGCPARRGTGLPSSVLPFRKNLRELLYTTGRKMSVKAEHLTLCSMF